MTELKENDVLKEISKRGTELSQAIKQLQEHRESLKMAAVYYADDERMNLANAISLVLAELDKYQWRKVEDGLPELKADLWCTEYYLCELQWINKSFILEKQSCYQVARMIKTDGGLVWEQCGKATVIRWKPITLPETEETLSGVLAKAIREAEAKCEHGKGLTDYCQPCGRINGG